MLSFDEFKNEPMGKALVQLSLEMSKNNIEPIEFDVIGGFALMLHKVRKASDITDIDYVGDSKSDEFLELADKVGRRFGLSKGWINNDVMLSGISLEDFEYTTGKLHFNKCMDIGNISINVLDKRDLLRMKLISIDTSFTAIENGGDFTRAKDLPDIVQLMSEQNLKPSDLMNEFGDYLINDNTPMIVQTYVDGRMSAVMNKIEKLQSASSFIKKPNEPYVRSSFMENFMADLTAEAARRTDLDDLQI